MADCLTWFLIIGFLILLTVLTLQPEPELKVLQPELVQLGRELTGVDVNRVCLLEVVEAVQAGLLAAVMRAGRRVDRPLERVAKLEVDLQLALLGETTDYPLSSPFIVTFKFYYCIYKCFDRGMKVHLGNYKRPTDQRTDGSDRWLIN